MVGRTKKTKAREKEREREEDKANREKSKQITMQTDINRREWEGERGQQYFESPA